MRAIPPPGAVSVPGGLEAALSLIDLIRNTDKYELELKNLYAISAECVEAIKEAHAAIARADEVARDALADERARIEATIAEHKKHVDDECAAREKVLTQRESSVTGREQSADIVARKLMEERKALDAYSERNDNAATLNKARAAELDDREAKLNERAEKLRRALGEVA